jgi:SRSO17 transposase
MVAEDPEWDEVAAWAVGLEALHTRIAGRFGRTEARGQALAYLRGLLSPVERKNGWQLAEQAGEANPYGMQRLLASYRWDADLVRDDLRAYVVEYLGAAEAVLVVDETGFLKKGEQSVGVQRQYSGTAGRIENCQVGVFLAYAHEQGRVLVDRELYLPRVWVEDRGRCRKAGVPDAVAFHTKPELARLMLERALAAQVPFGWVTGDEVYGDDGALRGWLEQRPLRYVLAVRRTQRVWVTGAGGAQEREAAAVVAALGPTAWQRRSAGAGAKGLRWYDWAVVELALLARTPGWGYWLLVRRSLSDPTDLAYYLVFAPQQTTLEQMVRVAGLRWAVEECFAAAKGEVGLDHYEVRSWQGWYRHMTLVLLAHAYLTVVRTQAGTVAGEKGGR